jgi:FKBP-type peptidyl-prolyl cis-trans isomerase FkpA
VKHRNALLACAAALLPLVASAADPAAAQPAAEAAGEAGQQAATMTLGEAGPQLLTEDLRPGVGEVARSGTQLIVHYTGWLYEPRALGYRGRKFDSSRDRGQAFTFRLGEGRVIRGWEVGIPGMRVGGLRRLVIPPGMAYGDRAVGNGLIPPGSTLVFEVELLGVESTIVTENSK